MQRRGRSPDRYGLGVATEDPRRERDADRVRSLVIDFSRGDKQDRDVMKTNSAHTSKGHRTKHTPQIRDVCSKVHWIINEERRL